VVDVSTVKALSRRRNGGTLRALAADLGLAENTIATLSDVLRERPGALTAEAENDLRRRLGLPTIITIPVAPCPTCGGDHGMKGIPDCGGLPIASVAILRPGEVVADAGDVVKRPTKARPRKPDERGTLHVEKSLVAEINARRGSLSQAAYIKHLMEGEVQ
jgi:hypothetical protein